MPVLCSSAAASAVCTRIYSSECAHARGRLNHGLFFFFLYAVFCHCSEARNWAAEKKATPTSLAVFLKQIFYLFIFFFCPWKAIQWLFFPPFPCVIIFLKFVEWVPESLQLGGNLPLFNSFLALTAYCQVAAGGFSKGGREGSGDYEDMAVLNSLVYSAPRDTWISSFCFSLLQKNCTSISRSILQECPSNSYLSSA